MSYISPQPEQSSPEEIELLTELNDLPNSSDNEFLKKVGGSIINSPIGSHINIGELGDVRITDVNSNDFLQYDSDNAVWINRNSIILNGFTQGSILFAGAGGVITQDNANAFWDNVNKRMGIGTNSPVESLDISGAIKVGTTANTNVGAIRYDGSNFQGYNGSWVDLDTQGGGSSGVIGSVQFSDGAGGFSSDNSNFFWDDSNNRLGIGTNSLVANTQLTLRGQTNGGSGNILLGQDSLGATQFTLTDQGKLTLPV